MIFQLFVPFVKAVGGSEEATGSKHEWQRHAQLSASVPHGIEARIVHFQELAASDVLTQVDPRIFKFESPCAGGMRVRR